MAPFVPRWLTLQLPEECLPKERQKPAPESPRFHKAHDHRFTLLCPSGGRRATAGEPGSVQTVLHRRHVRPGNALNGEFQKFHVRCSEG